MLTIGIISATGGRYYTDLARSGYYTSGGESPGRWYENEAAPRLVSPARSRRNRLSGSLTAIIRRPVKRSREITVTTTAVRRWISALACLKM